MATSSSRLKSKEVAADAMIEAAVRMILEGDPHSAFSLLKVVREGDAHYAKSLHVAGLAAAGAGQPLQAIHLLAKAVTLQPDNAGWLLDLARVQYAQRQWAQSAASFEKATYHAELGGKTLRFWARALRNAGEYGHCIEVLNRYVAAEPDDREARTDLADLYGICGFHYEELRHREFLAGQGEPRCEALPELARAQIQSGQTAEACASWELLLDRSPEPRCHSEYLVALLHRESEDAASLRRAHQEWARRYVGRPFESAGFTNLADHERRIRVGYVCGESAGAPSYYFLKPLLHLRDRERFHVTWYHASVDRGGRTEDYAVCADAWRNIARTSDTDAVAQIRADEIDILVDVSGHYEGSRPGIFAMRPAPIQACFPNYPCTTGVPGIDYIFTDERVCPEGAEGQYTEAALKIASGYLTYSAPDAPAVSALPAGRSGRVTFGIFQRPGKFNNRFWDAVAAILREIEGSALLVHYGSRELDEPDSLAQQALRRELEERCVSAVRVEFAGRLLPHEHLGAIARADIALDTFPYNGQTTTCECLLMGVPVVSLAGGHHVARVGQSILDRVGCGDLCAKDPAEYARLAVELARDQPRLQMLRTALRTRLQESSLMDGRSVRELEGLYRSLWRGWCTKTLYRGGDSK